MTVERIYFSTRQLFSRRQWERMSRTRGAKQARQRCVLFFYLIFILVRFLRLFINSKHLSSAIVKIATEGYQPYHFLDPYPIGMILSQVIVKKEF